MGFSIARFRHNGRVRWGVVKGDAVVPADIDDVSLGDVLTADRRTLAAVADNASAPTVPAADVDLLAPVTAPAQIVCQGVNYADHRQESGLSTQRPSFNTIFTKATSSLCGSRDDIVRPDGVRLLDYEVEMGLVIGAEIDAPTDITSQTLGRYVAGIVIANDVSARDVQIPQGQWYKGKSFRRFCPVGPYIYLLDDDETDLIHNLDLRLWVNGELRQASNTGNLMYKPAETLTELSGIMDLHPGDLLMTGTPGGVQLRLPTAAQQRIGGFLYTAAQRSRLFLENQETRDYLQNGDVVRATILTPDGRIRLGVQENKVSGAPYTPRTKKDDVDTGRALPWWGWAAVAAVLIAWWRRRSE